MSNKKQISELDDKNKPELAVDDDVINNPAEAQKLSKNYRLKYIDKKSQPSSSSSSYSTTTSMVSEVDAVIEPQDKETIKYLSNVKDPDTGKVSQPFVIGGKNYQMVRGITPTKKIVLAVYCLDELDEKGKNIIYSEEDFDKNIATPIKKLEEEQMMAKKAEEDKQLKAKAIEDAKQSEEIESSEEPNYEGSKHFLVNRNNGKVRNFKSIKELLSQGKLDEEDYMGVQEFKQHINKKMFGGRKKTEMLSELNPTGEESEQEMSVKAKKLMDLIQKRIPDNIIRTIKTPVAKREVIAAFAEMIGVPRSGLSNLVSGLKDMAKVAPPVQQQQQQQAIQERKVITKNDLVNSLKITKTIKVKDIK